MKTKKIFLIILTVLFVLIISVGGVYLFKPQKIFSIEGLTFEYPNNWKVAEYINKSGSIGGEIKNEGGTQRIIVLSGINQGNTEQEQIEFIDSLIEDGNEKLTLDGSEAAKGKLNYQGSKITTVFLNARNKKFQYSISYQLPESISDAEADKMFDKILSSIKLK